MTDLTKQRVLITKIYHAYDRDCVDFYVLDDLIGNSGDDVMLSFTSLGYFVGPKVGDEVILTRDPSKTSMWSYEILSSDENLQIEKDRLDSARELVFTLKNNLKRMWRTRMCELRNKSDYKRTK